MADFKDWLSHLRQSQHITRLSLSTAPVQQGAYILWLDTQPRVCLKIGIANVLKRRLRTHFASDFDKSVLARHLAADKTSRWAKGIDFLDRQQRRAFLAANCYFQTLCLPDLNRQELREFEDYIQMQLKPKYAGNIHKNGKESPQ